MAHADHSTTSSAPRRLTPRTALWLAGVIIMASAAAYVLRHSRSAVSVRRDAGQNVLLVTIDTWRSDGLSAAGGVAQTPQLDRLAADGIRFDFAHAHAVVTLPSHASILTGLYPYAHGVRDNAGFRLAPAIPTLASRLKSQGYATGAFVGAFPVAAQFGLNQGFEVYDDRFGEMRGPWDLQTAERPATEVVRAARAWIAARPSKWFAWVHVFDPHAPYRPPPPFDAQYAQAPYAGELAYTDSALGPLFDDVRRQPRRTLVIVTGDHGEALGEHGEATHGLFAYESTLRVPLIVTQLAGSSSRAATTAPLVRHEPVRHIDIVPTVLDAVRAPAASDLPGLSLVPLIDGSEPPRSDVRAASYFEAMSATFNRGWAPLRGILVGGDKYIDLPIPELYDLSRDAFEQDNAVARTGDRARELERRLRDLRADAASPRSDVDPETAKRLAALGYVSGTADRKSRYSEADDPKRLLPLDQALHRGVALVAEGRIREAIAEYERVIAERPDTAVAASHLAYLHVEPFVRTAPPGLYAADIQRLRAMLRAQPRSAAR